MRLFYTPEAIADLQRLHDFVAEKHPLAARKIAIEIQDAAGRLKAFPRIGLPVSRADDPDLLRDLYIGHYTLRYLLSPPRSIHVLRIWHNKEVERDL